MQLIIRDLVLVLDARHVLVGRPTGLAAGVANVLEQRQPASNQGGTFLDQRALLVLQAQAACDQTGSEGEKLE